MSETPEEPTAEEKEAWGKSLTAGSLPTSWKPGDPPPAGPPPAAPPGASSGGWVPPLPQPTPAAAAPVAPPAAPAGRDPEQTLHLERSRLEATDPPPAARPAADYERTMDTGTYPAQTQKASLSVRSGPDTGAKFAIDSSPLYIGRAPDNGVVVNDPATSRRHARFELRGQDYLVVDLGSANGTLVDGARVVEQVLVNGAVVTMGQNELVVTIT